MVKVLSLADKLTTGVSEDNNSYEMPIHCHKKCFFGVKQKTKLMTKRCLRMYFNDNLRRNSLVIIIVCMKSNQLNGKRETMCLKRTHELIDIPLNCRSSCD